MASTPPPPGIHWDASNKRIDVCKRNYGVFVASNQPDRSSLCNLPSSVANNGIEALTPKRNVTCFILLMYLPRTKLKQKLSWWVDEQLPKTYKRELFLFFLLFMKAILSEGIFIIVGQLSQKPRRLNSRNTVPLERSHNWSLDGKPAYRAMN